MSRSTVSIPFALLALVGAGACQRRTLNTGSPSASIVTWVESQPHTYAARLQSRAELGQGGSPFDVELTGKLDIVPSRVRGDTVELVFALREPKLRSGSQADADRPSPALDQLAGELGQPSMLTLSAGRITEQRFASGLSPVAAAMVRTLGAAIQVAAPPPGAQTWTAVENDGTGEYLAAYDATGPAGTIRKRKVAYQRVLISGRIDAPNRARVTPKVAGSTGALRIEHGALAAVELEDRIESQVLSTSAVTVVTKLALQLEPTSPEKTAAPDRAALIQRTVAYAPDRPYGGEPGRALFDDARLGSRTYEQIAAELAAQAAERNDPDLWGARNAVALSADVKAAREDRLRARVATFNALVAALRLQPASVEKAQSAVRAGSPISGALLDGLAAAGTEPAQAALAELLADGGLPRWSRVAVAGSLVRVQAPTPRTIDLLQSLLGDPQLQEHAIYGLGSAARRLQQAGEAVRARAIAELLIQRLRSAAGPEDQIRCLRGIANSAYPGALAALGPYAAAPDRRVRAAAVEATRLIAEPEADTFIAARMTADSDARVRMTAVRVAENRKPSASLAAALSAVALHDDNASARQRAVELIGRWLPQQPALRSTLEEVGKQDARAEIRAASLAALRRI